MLYMYFVCTFMKLIIQFSLWLGQIHILQKDLNLNPHLRNIHTRNKVEIAYCVRLVSKIIKTIERLSEV